MRRGSVTCDWGSAQPHYVFATQPFLPRARVGGTPWSSRTWLDRGRAVTSVNGDETEMWVRHLFPRLVVEEINGEESFAPQGGTGNKVIHVDLLRETYCTW
ncbi:hypothetical protein GW17_00032391 [Ensete ventricosum]|nr:hypothetical protein GW17_00032391 [Ensete ventricosum]